MSDKQKVRIEIKRLFEEREPITGEGERGAWTLYKRGAVLDPEAKGE